MRSGRVAAAGLAFAASLLIAAPAFAAATVPGPVRLRVGVVGPIGALDPARATTQAAREIDALQYASLTTFSLYPLHVAPGLAATWTATGDGSSFVYTLRAATWSDGSPVTAGDVVASLDRARDEKWPVAAGRLDGITAVARGRAVVEVTRSGAAGPLPSLPVPVVPARQTAPPGTPGALGSGDWVVAEQRADSVRMVVVNRPGRPVLDEITFRSYRDSDALEDAIARGDVDIAAGIRASRYRALQDTAGVTAIHANDGDQWVLRLAATDATVRHAISRAVDRDALVQTLARGVGRAQVVPIVARAEEWALPSDQADALDTSLAYDVAATRAYGERAPHSKLTLATPDDATGTAIGRELTRQLAAAGITLVPVTNGARADVTLVRREPGDDPTVALAPYTCAGGVWCDATFDASFARLTTDADVEARHDAVHAMVQRIAEQAVEVVLFAPDELQAYRTDRVTGMLAEPADQRLVVFWPSIEQYRAIHAAPLRGAEELPGTTYAALALSGAAVIAVAVFVVDRIVHARR